MHRWGNYASTLISVYAELSWMGVVRSRVVTLNLRIRGAVTACTTGAWRRGP